MTERTKRIIVGAIAAAAVGAVTYLAGQGVLTLELATAIAGLIAFAAGYFVPKPA